MNAQLLLAFALLVGSAAAAPSSKIQCVDDNNKPVDWMVVYKIPQLDADELNTGFEYATITSKSKGGWVLSQKKTTDKDSVFGLNFGQAYDDFNSGSNKLSSVMWSDQPENGHPSAGYAHAKGVLIADAKSGIIFTHSIPQFAPGIKGDKITEKNPQYGYPSSGTNNGQTAICISFDSQKSLETLGEYIYIVRPYIYSAAVQDDVASMAPKLQTLLTEKRHQKVGSSSFEIQSAGGMKFKLFAKSAQDQVEFYADQIAPQLGVNLLANTWLNGAGGKLGSECSMKQTVETVETIELKFDNSKAVARFPTSRDHSKWAVSAPKESSNWVCIADVNRMKSQAKRGGGALCFQDKRVHDTFVKSSAEVSEC